MKTLSKIKSLFRRLFRRRAKHLVVIEMDDSAWQAGARSALDQIESFRRDIHEQIARDIGIPEKILNQMGRQ